MIGTYRFVNETDSVVDIPWIGGGLTLPPGCALTVSIDPIEDDEIESSQDLIGGGWDEVTCGRGEMPPPYQPRDQVRFALGTRPIEIDAIRDPATGLVSIMVDNAEVIKVGPEFEWAAYEAARETARRIGQREI